jgi:hypothetical protein
MLVCCFGTISRVFTQLPNCRHATLACYKALNTTNPAVREVPAPIASTAELALYPPALATLGKNGVCVTGPQFNVRLRVCHQTDKGCCEMR